MSPPSPSAPALASRFRRPSPAASIAIAVAFIAVAALGHVHLRLAVLQAGYDLSRETKLKRDLEDQNQKLRLELETRRDPQMIERRARDELGMAAPDTAAIRIIRPDGTAIAPPPGSAPAIIAPAVPVPPRGAP